MHPYIDLSAKDVEIEAFGKGDEGFALYTDVEVKHNEQAQELFPGAEMLYIYASVDPRATVTTNYVTGDHEELELSERDGFGSIIEQVTEHIQDMYDEHGTDIVGFNVRFSWVGQEVNTSVHAAVFEVLEDWSDYAEGLDYDHAPLELTLSEALNTDQLDRWFYNVAGEAERHLAEDFAWLAVHRWS